MATDVESESRQETGEVSHFGLLMEYDADWRIEASGPEESEALPNAALADCLDSCFIPEPKRFLLYPDHDEYTTPFASRKGQLLRLAIALTKDTRKIKDYTRTLSRLNVGRDRRIKRWFERKREK